VNRQTFYRKEFSRPKKIYQGKADMSNLRGGLLQVLYESAEGGRTFLCLCLKDESIPRHCFARLPVVTDPDGSGSSRSLSLLNMGRASVLGLDEFRERAPPGGGGTSSL